MNISTSGLPTYSYPEYFDLVAQLVSQGKTSGLNQSKDLINFTLLNHRRMDRLNKTVELSESFKRAVVTVPEQEWLIITEAWCGDSAQILPVLAKMADQSEGHISVKIIFRDEYPHLIEKYNTNGSKSIPKLISFDKDGVELFLWGPRPAPAQELFMSWKLSENRILWNDFELQLHTWYSKDKTHSIQKEIGKVLKLQPSKIKWN